MTKKYGILASPAKHSLSPVMHNAAFKELGIDAQYGVFEIPETGLREFIEHAKHEPMSGLSVSLPHKETVMDYLNKVDEDAKKIGAVNTIVNKGGFLYGYNTDFLGSNRSIKDVYQDLKGVKVVVIGAGGATRGIVYGLLKEGAEVKAIFNRSVEKAVEIAQEFGMMFGVGIEGRSLDDLATLPYCDDLKAGRSTLIQTSSIWTLNPKMSEGEIEAFCPSDYVDCFDVVMDIVYQPLKTPLLKIAEEKRKTVITGEKMLLYQAVEQFKIWTDQDAPIEIMREELMKNIKL
ncbi:shikimate dehydrogenase [Patescibacteria group bacterium]